MTKNCNWISSGELLIFTSAKGYITKIPITLMRHPVHRIDLTGARIGLWFILRRDDDRLVNGRKYAYWLCECACGLNKPVEAGSLIHKRSLSCGCDKNRKIGEKNSTHGMSRECQEYRIWTGMKIRCENKKSTSYKRYGALGIAVHAKWRDSFEEFMKDVGPRPSSSHSLDRIDGTKGYEPGNVRWATAKQQQNNRLNNTKITISGSSRTLSEWSTISGLSAQTIASRRARGWDDASAVFTPRKRPGTRRKRELQAAE